MKRDITLLAALAGACLWLTDGCATRPFPSHPVTSHGPDWIRDYGQYRVEMRMNPASPRAREDVAIEFLVLDTAKSTPVRIRGAFVRCSAHMMDSGETLNLRPARTDILNREPGVYPLRFVQFPYGGQWQLTAFIQLLDDTSFFAQYSIAVEGPPWPRSRDTF